ncbi:metal ABC transporter permease [Quadrisphaera sp. DSM 44207]|uniref:metal ABC transporter permease n=1 Tax=Quadrisphaera sp. DSM 44207 TaxID=1881057 RepID=UPI000B89AB00
MQRALLVTVVASAVAALLSCWLVLVGWSLMGDAVSHAVLPGVVLSYAAGLPFAVGAVVFGAGSVVLIDTVARTTGVKRDAAIGVVFSSLFALGLVLVSVVPSQVDLGHVLFGNVLGVPDAELAQVVLLGLAAAAVAVLKRRDLTLYAFDPVHAAAIGISPRRLGVLLLALLTVTVVVGLQAVGVVLVVAMLIIPGATASLLADRIDRMLLLAPLLASGCAVAGLWTAYLLDTSPGGMVVLCQGVLFALVHAAGSARRALAHRRATRSAPGVGAAA